MRGEEANENAGGADADDRRPCAEEGGEMGREALVSDIGGAFEGRRAVDRAPGSAALMRRASATWRRSRITTAAPLSATPRLACGR